jgi:HK97 family phage prohead protease
MKNLKITKNYDIKFKNFVNKNVTDVNILKFLEETGNDINDFYVVSGIASTDSVDSDNERIELSAWNDTLKNGYEYPAFYNHEIYNYPIGKVFITSLTDSGLYVTFLLPKDASEISGKIYPQLKCRTINSMSIGGYATDYEDKGGVRIIKGMVLREISLVVFPANPDAKIQSIKSIGKLKKFKIAPKDTVWDKSSAMDRFRKFTNSTEKPSDTYRDCFLWFDETKKDQFGAYKFPFVDVINGELTIVPKAIFSAKAYLNRAYNEPNIPEEDINKLQELIIDYYKLMELEVPEFKKYKSIEDFYSETLKTITDFSEELKYKGFSNREANIFISKLKSVLDIPPVNRNENIGKIDNDYQKSDMDISCEFYKGLLEKIKK